MTCYKAQIESATSASPPERDWKRPRSNPHPMRARVRLVRDERRPSSCPHPMRTPPAAREGSRGL
jgi:hypothetical protein